MKKQLSIVLLLILCSFSYSTNLPIKNGIEPETNTVVIDTESIAKWKETNQNLQEIDKEKYHLSDFTLLKDYQNQFAYFLLDRIKLSNNYDSYLIYEYYESESYVYLVNYDKIGNYIDSKVVYYDNDEGAWLITSIIDINAKSLKVNEYNEYENPKDKAYNITILPNGIFKK